MNKGGDRIINGEIFRFRRLLTHCVRPKGARNICILAPTGVNILAMTPPSEGVEEIILLGRNYEIWVPKAP